MVPTPSSVFSNKVLKVDHVDQSRPGQEDESHALFPHRWLHHFYTSHLYVFCHLPEVGQAPLSTECQNPFVAQPNWFCSVWMDEKRRSHPRCMAWTSRALKGFQRSHFYLRNMVILTFGGFGRSLYIAFCLGEVVMFVHKLWDIGGKCRGLEFRYGVLIYFMLAFSFVVFVYQRFNQSTKRTKRERYLPCCGCCNI